MKFELGSISLLKLTVVILSLAKIISQNEQPYQTCRRTFECGDITEIGYPFWGGDRPQSCGYPSFGLTCLDNTPRLNISSASYRVLEINSTTRTLRIARDDLSSTLCPRFIHRTVLDSSPFHIYSVHGDQNVTLLYGCGASRPPPEAPPVHNRFDCDVNGSSTWGYYLTEGLIRQWSNVTGACEENITVPVGASAARDLANVTVGSVGVLREALGEGFWVGWRADDERCRGCVGSGGLCGCDPDSGSFACYCADGTRDYSCNVTGNNNNLNTGLRIGLPIGCAVLACIGIGWLVLYFRQSKKQRVERLGSRSNRSMSKEIITPWSKPLSRPPSTNASKSGHLFRTTSNSNLGWGSMYYGVQVFDYAELEEATDNFDPSRILGDGGFGTVYHVAVKRLYENNLKQVEQFMNEVKILTNLRHKNLVSLYGCTSRRSRQLLLVYEFVSNGTVADHLHGRLRRANPSSHLPWPVRLDIALTEKSDVYSFGVVLVELLSSLMAVDTNRHRQDINLASMAISKIQNRALDELVDPSLGFGTDAEVRRAVTSVAELAFWCLQWERDMRPSMGDVLAGLRRIRDGGHKVEVLDLRSGDDVGPPLRESMEPPSPDSGSGQNSSG
ncbi:protein kinase family protein [Striga asiatica]|uniref:non-specific serine/threonine protein kinase n=1 Tax=Striga asiatica TaxID=4170 RepID=A0A5A7QW15_STRAF|nr:protein kinase family protein [Striga asiatica]